MAAQCLVEPRSCDAPTDAGRLAKRNLAANASALRRAQPEVEAIAGELPGDLEFVFARDGWLTALNADGGWRGGCSLPGRAARRLLEKLEAHAPVACLLPPPHSACVRVALDKTAPPGAVVALAAGAEELAFWLACENFAAEIDAGRLWFAVGPDFGASLGRLFDDRPGLLTPTQFIRVPSSTPEAHAPTIAAAQSAFAAVLGRRAKAIKSARDAWRPSGRARPRVCVVAGRHFRLWDDAPFALASVLTGGAAEWVRLDADEPARASPVALLSSAIECDAVVSADVARADLPDILPAKLPWITWLTRARVPAFALAGERDALLVADPAWTRRAIEAGWPAERVGTARWSVAPARSLSPALMPRRALGLIADTSPLDPPAGLDVFSSHLLLWNSIRQELLTNPLWLVEAESPERWLDDRRSAFGVGVEGWDRALFLRRLVLPAYAQGIARLLVSSGLPLRLYGAGWSEIDEFASFAAGPVTTRDELGRAVAASAALVHAWPSFEAHAIESVGRPLARPRGRRAADFVAAARAALRAPQSEPVDPPDALHANRLLAWVSAVRG